MLEISVPAFLKTRQGKRNIDHARQVHNISEFSKDFYDKSRSAIRDVEAIKRSHTR